VTRKLLIALAALALASFGLVACGGDDDDEPTDPVVTEAEEPANGNGAAGEGGTLEIAADGNDLAYTTGDLETEAGTVTIEFDNPSNIDHDVRIEDSSGNDLGGTEIITESSTTAEVDLEPGTYTYYCSVAGHRAAGMEGTLTVE
jgi:plastocyanin